MKSTRILLIFLLCQFISGCIVQFIPETDEDKDILVVEGIITDQPEVNTIKLSRSLPLGSKNVAKPVKGSVVSISDDTGNSYRLRESVPGTYVTDASQFIGKIGRFYTLHISTTTGNTTSNYQSYPMEMRPVPPIDTIFYEKTIIADQTDGQPPVEGCQIYLNTHDPTNNCSFYRWEYSETWEFRLPYTVPNKICWISGSSGDINVKSTMALAEDRVSKLPIKFISNNTDRLKVKYSILVNQYSLNEEEFEYWEKLHVIGEQVGGLYDMIPSSIPTNLWCVEDPEEIVLGFFSVSARSSKRIFIKDYFTGIVNLYANCASDTVYGLGSLESMGYGGWVIEDHTIGDLPPYRVLTDKKGCADCTVRGTTTEPLFWKSGK